MKNTNATKFVMPIVAAIFILVSTQSCKKADVQEETVAKTDAHLEELKQFIASSTGMALSKVTYSEKDKNFVVDEDGNIALDDAEARFKENRDAAPTTTYGTSNTQQRRNNYIVSRSIVPQITIYADASVPSIWLPILDKSIANWNSTGSLVKITRIYTNSANITVNANYSTSSMVASSNYPDIYGNPGKRITINTYKNSIADAKKIFAITHEVGHTLGFTHTDGTYGTLIPGTSTSDGSSIMNSVCLYWSAFTTYDLTAFRTVYPL